ncbi:spindle assembly checkpoint component MAD1-like, partial [Drosophila erecta]
VSTDTNNFLDLEKNSETLQKLVETFFTKLGGLDTINLNVTLNICQENNETLSKIQSKIEFLLKHNSKTCFEGSSGGSESTSLLIIKNCSSNENLHNSIAELQNQTENLRNELKKFPKCCQKIDSLSLNVGKLEKQMKEMNQTYNDHINANAKQLNSIKENMGESLRKLGDNHTADNESLSKLARKLKKDLKKGSLTLGFLKERQDGLLKDRNTTQISLYSPDEMNGLKKDLDEFRQVIDGKLKDLELKKQSKIDDRQRLERFNTETNQDLDKLNKISLVHKELEMRIKEQIEGLIKKANEMLECKKNCSKIDTMNDLMDQVEDMEKILKKSKT